MVNHLFPFFRGIDSWMSQLLPLPLRLVLWGVLSGALAMIIYVSFSPQERIANLKKRSRDLRKRLRDPDMEFKEFYALSIHNLKTSVKQLLFVTGPAIASSLPIILVALWIHSDFGYAFPSKISNNLMFVQKPLQNPTVSFEIQPSHTGNFKKDDSIDFSNANSFALSMDRKKIYEGNPFNPPTACLYKRKWWNFLIESPNGYLLPNSPIDQIRINVPKYRIIEGLPDWAAGWELPYFLSVFACAMFFKIKFRIQ
jgi:hypothetical protein